jgi:hypothetical protein
MQYDHSEFLNQRCIRQHWFGISAVSDSADSRIFIFEYEYLHEFETEFENILGCESGAYLGSTSIKKSRATVPLIYTCIFFYFLQP